MTRTENLSAPALKTSPRRSAFGSPAMKMKTRLILLTTAVFIALLSAGQAATQVFSFTGSDQVWVVPNGVTSATFTCYGGGGGSGGAIGNSLDQAAGGGGGGATSLSAQSVTPGESLTITVGGGGTAGASTGTNGGPGGTTTVKRAATALVTALGGGGGGGVTVGGGTGTAGLGAAAGTGGFAGGNGTTGLRDASAEVGGAGGGGAGNAGAGGNGTQTTTSSNTVGGAGGIGSPNNTPFIGGAGAGATTTGGSLAGVTGSVPGGGASGAATFTTASAGATGGNGQVVVTWVGIPISGTRTVGPTGDYATLTAAIADVTANGINGAMVLELQSTYVSTSETFPIVVGNITGNSGTNTITVRPQTGATALSISGSNTTAIIDLNGAQNVIFDGRPGGIGTAKQLTLANTSTTGTVVRFINDALSNKLTFCTITGVTTSTTNGVVFFSTTTGANGNDNNTIDTCDITAGASTPTNGIYSSGTTTTTATNNSGNLITNSNISNYFSATSTSIGILVSGGSTDWTISNNKFFQTATRTQTTTSLTHSAIQIANSTSGNNFQITGNTIGFASSTGTGTYTFVLPASTSGGFIPINLSVGTTTATSVQNNLIAGIAISGAASGTSSSAPFRGIYISSGLVNIGNVSGNTIGSLAATGSITYTSSSSSTSEVIGMFNFGSNNWTTNNNNIGGITASNSSTGATNVYGIRVNTSSTATFTCQNNTIGGTVANSIQSTTTAAGTIVNGILNSAPAGTITGNTIRNLTAAGGTGTTTSASVVGIVNSASSANHTVSQNTIQTLTNTSAASATTVIGIHYTASSGTNVVARNLIHSFSVASTTAIMNGINVGGGTTTYKNNMVRLGVDASGNSITTACLINGINEPALGTDNFFNNSVFIGGTGVGTTLPSPRNRPSDRRPR